MFINTLLPFGFLETQLFIMLYCVTMFFIHQFLQFLSSFPMLPCYLLACSTLPDVPRANISEETKKAFYQEGDMIHFTCESGYTPGPTIIYVCTSRGWLAVRQGTCNCKLNVFLLYSWLCLLLLLWSWHKCTCKQLIVE